jgi:undecaprenyl-diphosphatase
MSLPTYPLQMIQPEQWKEAEKTWLAWDSLLSEKLITECKNNLSCFPFFKIISESDLVKYSFYLSIGICLWFSCKKLKNSSKFFLILCLSITISIGDVFSNLIKNVTTRLRPEQILEHFRVATVKFSFSFPSNHAFNLFALSTALWIFHKKRYSSFSFLHRFSLSLALIISLGRVLMGRHYPSDVMAGMLIGSVFGALMINLSLHLGKRYKLIK